MSHTIRSFEELQCWKACRDLRVFVSRRIVPQLPGDERYLLRSQLLNASRSTTANIAEGYGRFHYLDNAKFCRNARGSCCETLDHLITAFDERFIDDQLLVEGRQLVSASLRPLNGYIGYLIRAADQ